MLSSADAVGACARRVISTKNWCHRASSVNSGWNAVPNKRPWRTATITSALAQATWRHVSTRTVSFAKCNKLDQEVVPLCSESVGFAGTEARTSTSGE